MSKTTPTYDVRFFEDLKSLSFISTDRRTKALKGVVKLIEGKRVPFSLGFDLFRSNAGLSDDMRTLLSIKICRDALKRSPKKAQFITERSRKPLELYFYDNRKVSPKEALDGMVTSFMAKKFRYLNDEDLALVKLIFGLELDGTPEDVTYFESEMRKTSR